MRLLKSIPGMLLAASLLVSTATAIAQEGPTSAARVAAPDTTVLRTVGRQVSGIRGLPPLAEPELTVLDNASLEKYLHQQFDKDYWPNERESDQKSYVALGLISPTDNLVQLQLGLLQAQVLGIYDPDTKSMFVVDNGSGLGAAQRQTYAHEFSHALQDQHFNLNALAPKHGDNNDRSLAVHALIEGDAVLLQNLWAASNMTADDLQQLARLAAASDTGLDRVPEVIRAELLFPYLEGVRFVVRAYVEGGRDFAAINALFTHPPTSTAQVLHYDKYLADSQPLDVALPDLAAAAGPGWRRIGGGVLGELDTRVLLEKWGAGHSEATRVAAGWAGDRWQMVERDGRSALVLRSVWESEDAAHNFFDAYARGLQIRFDGALAVAATATHQALTTSLAATDLWVDGNEVVVVLASVRQAIDVLRPVLDGLAPAV